MVNFILGEITSIPPFGQFCLLFLGAEGGNCFSPTIGNCLPKAQDMCFTRAPPKRLGWLAAEQCASSLKSGQSVRLIFKTKQNGVDMCQTPLRRKHPTFRRVIKPQSLQHLVSNI